MTQKLFLWIQRHRRPLPTVFVLAWLALVPVVLTRESERLDLQSSWPMTKRDRLLFCLKSRTTKWITDDYFELLRAAEPYRDEIRKDGYDLRIAGRTNLANGIRAHTRYHFLPREPGENGARILLFFRQTPRPEDGTVLVVIGKTDSSYIVRAPDE